MDLLINGAKLDVPAGTALVMLTPHESGDGYHVASMTIIGDSKDERAVYTLAHMARGLAYLAEENVEDVMEAGRVAADEGDTEYPVQMLLAGGLTLEDIEPEGHC